MLLNLGVASAAHAATDVLSIGGQITVLGASDAMDIDIDSPSAGVIRVVDADAANNLTAGAGCTEAPAETVECGGLSGATFDIEVFGSSAGDAIAVDPAATFPAQLYGRGGNDVLLGGGANDRLAGGTGNDDLDGRGGGDLVENGYNDSNVATSGDGGDIYRDTGASGQDSLNFGPQTVAVHMKVDGLANDGGAAGAEGDDIRGGFERLRGTAFNVVMVGVAAPETINGSGGDDDLDGGAGADAIEGNEGVDTVRARDGEADALLDCDSASASSFGAGETAFIDAVDPEPARCEVVDRLGGPTAPGDPAPPAPAPAPGGTIAPATTFTLGAVKTTETVSRMPRVTGKKFTVARDAALAAIPSAEVDIVFKRGCRQGDFLEVTKQQPLTGASLPNDSRDPVAVQLTACIAEADYLRDCDLESVRSDVKRLGNKALDADVASAVLGSVNRCKVDYDIKLAKAAEEARIKLDAQRASEALSRAEREKENAKRQAADKVKADLRASITCPITGDLRISVTDGYTPSKRALGLKASGTGGWTIPSSPSGAYQSFIELAIFDRALQWPEATVFVDSDGVVGKGYGPAKRQTADGRTVFAISPTKPGKIRICVVQETGGDQVLSAGVEVEVVGPPPVGTVYETVSGRQLKLTKDGPVPVTPRAARAAQGGFFEGIWNSIVGLFSGRSRTVNTEEASPRPKRERTARVAEQAKLAVGQVSLDGELVSNPQPPVVNLKGACLIGLPNGAVGQGLCPVLTAPGGHALVGMKNEKSAVLAAGEGNVVKVGTAGFAPGTGTLVEGPDGKVTAPQGGKPVAAASGDALAIAPSQLKDAKLIGNDGGTLIGNDGSTLIGNDGSTLIGNDGSTLVNAGGLN
ncbi:MAG: hypothetical protein JHC84_17060 [Solirubrobacteraceae bacterium]|nr:hypothetical protein [Solirubrobacteraceae bacterium]